MNGYIERYHEWLNENIFDNETKTKLLSLRTNEEIFAHFSNDLKFGTGGIRGTMNVGTAHINNYTILRITQGFANYINNLSASDEAKRSVIVCYDSRNNSKEFALTTACCLLNNNISVYLFEALRPTPELSFAIRELHCIAGINITASHNPPEYNGYKVYGSDGVQISSSIAHSISMEIEKIQDYSFIKKIDFDRHDYQILPYDIDNLFIESIKKVIINHDIISEMADSIKIVYTPLFGSGITLVPKALKEIGFNNIFIVNEQTEPNGNFPGLKTPNPENTDTFEKALELARKVNADIIFATDPDADRFGVYAWCDIEQEYIHFTGNMIGALMCEYELSMLKKSEKKNVVFRTLVSSKMGIDICNYYDAICMETFTGFKHIGEQMELIATKKDQYSSGLYNFVMGYEESYGCVVGNYTRDKDSVGSIAVVCEMLAYYKKEKLSLWQQLNNLYKKYGYYYETAYSYLFDDLAKSEKSSIVMNYFRTNHNYSMPSFTLKKVTDFYNNTIYSFEDNTTTTFDHSRSNVIYFEFSDNSWACIRPSGTEPKLKIYVGVKKNSQKDSINHADLLIRELSALIDTLLKQP